MSQSMNNSSVILSAPSSAQSPRENHHSGKHHYGIRTSKSAKSLGFHNKLAPLDVTSGHLANTNSSKSISHKKELVEALRRTNPAGVNTAPSIFWDVEGALKTSNIDDSDVQQQMVIVENGVNYSVKRFNDLKSSNDRLTLELKLKLDELENQKKQFEAIDAMKKAETEEGVRIDNLHKEIDEVENHLRERKHYARKLDHMLSRLKSNQLKFDAHMVGMEDTMRSIQKDSAEIRLMRRGLDAGLAKAVIVLEETKRKLADTRKDREVMLDQRFHEHKNAKALQQWLRERKRMKAELGVELRGDLTVDEEMLLRSQIDEKTAKTKSLQRASEESLRKLQAMEEAFAKLKQVTGVKNVEEMHEKFSNQKSNKLQLEMEVKDAENRLNGAKKLFNKQEQIFQELKSSGIESAELNRDNINRLEELYIEARNDQKSIKADSERTASVLLGLHQGSHGLLQRIQPYLYLTEGGVFDLTQIGEEQSPWSETVDALTTAEHVLTKMMEAIAGDAAPSPGFEEEDDDHSAYSRDSNSIETQEEAPNQANNIRIRSKKVMRDIETEDDHLDNSNVNINTNNMMGNGNLNGNTNMNTNDLGTNGMIGNTNASGNNMINNGANVTGGNNATGHNTVLATELLLDSEAPSRNTVKKMSMRRSAEARRKEDMLVRRKRLMDRMLEAKNTTASATAGANNNSDDAQIGITARYKAQKAAAERLSVKAKPPTLPDGVTLRDDPMTKTIAFLHATPNLT